MLLQVVANIGFLEHLHQVKGGGRLVQTPDE